MPGPIAITRASPPNAAGSLDMHLGEASNHASTSTAMDMSNVSASGSQMGETSASGSLLGSGSGASFGAGASFNSRNHGHSGLGSILSTSNGRLSSTPGGALGASFTGPGSASYREAIARSFGKDAADIMDYSIARFSSSNASTDSNMTALPSTSFPRNKLETSFCRNFKCCGIALDNLHDLLQHYEEAHVKFEDDELPSMVDDDTSAASSSATSSQPPSPKSAAAAAAAAASSSSSGVFGSDNSSSMPLPPSSGTNDVNGEHLSAFDTTVMRSPIKGKKRSFGQFSNPAALNGNGGGLHQSLRRALIDGGVGRSSRASSVYSAGSPFSTPTSSIPGTPVPGDVDDETAFYGNGTNPAAAFSALSIRGNEDHDLPSCAPPNLFFPAPGTSSMSTLGPGAGANAAALQKNRMSMGVNGMGMAPPNKREKTQQGINGANGSLESSINNANFYSDRPYKCTSPGCDKAYKQMNGLKYHRLHGQCNQNMMPPTQQVTNAVADKSVAGPHTLRPGSGSSTPTGTESPMLGSGSSSPSSSSESTPSSPQRGCVDAATDMSGNAANSAARDAAKAQLNDKIYICQVGNCGKRYKNLNGLRYHYLHSGSHGMLGLQLLHSNGGGASARADAHTGRPAVSTNDLSKEALNAVAQAAAEQQALHQRNAMLKQQAAQQQAAQHASTSDSSSSGSPSKSATSAGPMAIPSPSTAAATIAAAAKR